MDQWLESLVPWGTNAIVWVQSVVSQGLDPIFKFFTYLGYEELYLVLLPLVYWCISKPVGIGLGYIAMLSAWLNGAFKNIFDIARPCEAPNSCDTPIRIPLPETSFSFPSGHAQNAVANWGYLALHFRRWTGWVVAVILMLGIGLSRIVLGVHFPEDVIGGWLIGLVLLAAFALFAPVVGHWVARQKMPVQVALATGLPFLLIFLHPTDRAGLYPAEDAVKTMSALIGMGVGVLMERAWLGFRVDGAWWRRALRLLVGLVIVVIFYAGPKLIIPDGLPYGLDTAVRLVRYVVLGWVIAFGCPWLFVRLKLADAEHL
ncbi:MAG: phosphatase PAP2 family protein [Anaerolineae bacterium]|nr:phosphatase PAP2 family protein [Anaerolineae bacterium]